MKILYHHRTASSDGQAVHIGEMIASLRHLGHEVRVVGPAAAHDGPMGAEVGWVGRMRAICPKAVYELLEVGYSAVAFVRLAIAVRAFRPDVIYERYNLFLRAGLLARRVFGVPLLLEVNSPLADERARFGGLALRRMAAWSERTLWCGADRVLPVTHVLARRVLARGVPAERIVVIPNGVNEAHFATAPAPVEAKARLGLDGRLVLGFTGFVRDWHGVDRIIRWMGSEQAPPNVHLLVVGDGPARADLERLAAELALRGRVTFTGVIAREHVPAHVAAFDVALQPAVVEYASPLKLFEYMALGKAVLAPRQPNVEEVLVHDVNALLFEPGDPAALPSCLERLVNDAQLRSRLGAEAARTIRSSGLTWLDNARRVAAMASDLAHVPPAAEGSGWRNAD